MYGSFIAFNSPELKTHLSYFDRLLNRCPSVRRSIVSVCLSVEIFDIFIFFSKMLNIIQLNLIQDILE